MCCQKSGRFKPLIVWVNFPNHDFDGLPGVKFINELRILLSSFKSKRLSRTRIMTSKISQQLLFIGRGQQKTEIRTFGISFLKLSTFSFISYGKSISIS